MKTKLWRGYQRDNRYHIVASGIAVISYCGLVLLSSMARPRRAEITARLYKNCFQNIFLLAMGKKQMTYKYRAILSKTLRDDFFGPYVDIPTFFEAKDGFWVNTHNGFTRDEDAAYWIPPTQIRYVERIKSDKA